MEGEKGNQLDFGWFKMPQTQDGLKSPTGGGEPAGGPAPQDTDIESQQSHNLQQLPNACQSPPSNACQRPPSNACKRPPSNAFQRPPSNACQRPPSNACQRPPSNACQRPPPNACQRPPSNACHEIGQANYCSADDAEMAYNRITESGCYELQPPPKSYDENIVIDWPMSNVGEEQFQRFQVPTGNAKIQDQRPNTSANRLQTPLPPLNMQGYGQERPTYATWRERWHREQQRSNGDYDENNNHNNNSNSKNNISDDVESCLFQHATDDGIRERSLLSLQSVNLEDDGLSVADDDHTTRKRHGPYKYRSLDGYQNAVAYTNETKAQPDEFVSSCLTFEVEENNQKRKRSLSRVLVDKLKSLSRWSRWHDAQDDVTCYKYDKLKHDRQN